MLEKYSKLKIYNILVLEDDLVSLKYLEKIFILFFNKVYIALDVAQAKKAYADNKINIILSDIYLPKEDGVSFVKYIRKIESDIPIVFLSACMESRILIDVIPCKVNFFLTKPANAEQILDTLNNVLNESLNKQSLDSDTLYRLINFVTIDINKKICKKESNIVNLTKKEFQLLELFIKNKNSTLDKNFIENYLWNGELIAESSVKTLIKKLRSKIGENTISTITNIGYKINFE